MSTPVLALFTDYGLGGPWVGLLHAVIHERLPQAAIVDLQHDLPPFRPRGAGLLLAAQAAWLPPAALVVAVVDPGVGSERRGLVVHWRGRRFIGPDNGLFAPMLREAGRIEVIDWRPEGIPPTFHGRDWFAPVATRLASGEAVDAQPVPPASCVGHAWPSDLDEVIYVDRFGNLVTGRRGVALPVDCEIRVGPHRLPWARTFSERPHGAPFWHVNALGLVELSVNQGSAAELLGLKVGDTVPICA